MKSGYRVMFLRDEKGQPVGCLAIGLTSKQRVVKYQVSVLNPIDRFDRKIARLVALGRLVESPFTAVLADETDVSMHQISRDVMMHLAYNKEVPSRASRAARRWLRNKSNK